MSKPTTPQVRPHPQPRAAGHDLALLAGRSKPFPAFSDRQHRLDDRNHADARKRAPRQPALPRSTASQQYWPSLLGNRRPRT